MLRVHRLFYFAGHDQQTLHVRIACPREYAGYRPLDQPPEFLSSALGYSYKSRYFESEVPSRKIHSMDLSTGSSISGYEQPPHLYVTSTCK